MPTYEEILTLVQNLNSDDRFRLLEDLKVLVYEPITIEGTNEVISAAEIADSDAALQDYQTGRDRGLSSGALKERLFVHPTSQDEKPKHYDFSALAGKLNWRGDGVAEQRKLRNEW